MIPRGMVRAGPIVAVPELLRGFGVDPAPLIAAAGLAPAALDDTETPLPLAGAGRLMALCAERTGCPSFGLLAGQQAGTAALGVLGLVMQHSPDVRAALQILLSHFNFHDAAGAIELRAGAATATLGYRILGPVVAGLEQIMDCALAIGVQLMRSLCGPEWRPVEALLAHPPPADPRPFKALVRAPLRFDADLSGFAFDASCLDRPLSHAQPALRAVLLEFMTARTPGTGNVLCDDVRRVLRARVTGGDASLAGVAGTLGLHPRTLHRRLAASGTTFKALVNEIRHETARQLLEQTTMPLSRIATVLGYAEASSFTRSFRGRAGMPPAAWRARRQRP